MKNIFIQAFSIVEKYSHFLSGEDFEGVMNAYLEAIFSYSPKNTYIVGLDSLLLKIGYWVFGENLWKVAKIFGLFEKPRKTLCLI